MGNMVGRGARARVGFGLAFALAVAAVVADPVAQPAVADSGSVTITGHGYGHGRGMGQYGAYGYAVNGGWSYSAILEHYYVGASLATNAGNPTIGVELTGSTSTDAIVTAPNLTINGTAVGSLGVLVRRVGSAKFMVYTATSATSGASACSGGSGWSEYATVNASSVTIATTADSGTLTNLLRLCTSSTTKGYRGSLVAVDAGGKQYLVNRLDTQSYLRGVVPREMPASWGSAGSGRGMQALMAQAVAARSYMLSGSTRTSGANTCDSTACQVYGGAYVWPQSASAPTALENSLSDTAVSSTSGRVMRMDSTSAVARTEFSSSTGGYTAGGTFSAIVDEGDGVSINPYHSWSTTTTLDAVASALGTGTISSIQVTGRNGLGDDGGRVTQVTVVNTSGTVRTFTGTQVRTALGLRSDWFSISAVSSDAAQAVVQALYADILGRGVDSAGLATWTAQIQSTGNASSTASALSYSDERLTVFVAEQYSNALHREPEAAGVAYWVGLLQSGWAVPDLQAGVYGSDESLLSLGQGDVLRWVAAMYESILGRSASASERQWWAQYAAANGRFAAVAGISHSEEAALVRLNGYYETMLGRGPDAAGIATFVPVLMAGRGDLTVPVYIGQSQEYWERAQNRF